jgi:hypothetical protein
MVGCFRGKGGDQLGKAEGGWESLEILWRLTRTSEVPTAITTRFNGICEDTPATPHPPGVIVD